MHTKEGEEDEKEETWEDMNLFDKTLFVIEFPLHFLRKITMPVIILRLFLAMCGRQL